MRKCEHFQGVIFSFLNIGFNLENSSSHDRPMLLPRLGGLEATDFTAFGV